jgi:hypothetical protein
MSGMSVDLKDYDIRKIIEDKNYLNLRKRVEIKVKIYFKNFTHNSHKINRKKI